jgi:hypothetical protein
VELRPTTKVVMQDGFGGPVLKAIMACRAGHGSVIRVVRENGSCAFSCMQAAHKAFAPQAQAAAVRQGARARAPGRALPPPRRRQQRRRCCVGSCAGWSGAAAAAPTGWSQRLPEARCWARLQAPGTEGSAPRACGLVCGGGCACTGSGRGDDARSAGWRRSRGNTGRRGGVRAKPVQNAGRWSSQTRHQLPLLLALRWPPPPPFHLTISAVQPAQAP